LGVARPIKSTLAREQNTPAQALGAVVTELRTQKKLSQQTFADKLGCSLSYINALERGKQNPSFKFIIAMAEVLGLKPSQLLARAERKYLKSRPTPPAGPNK
jgi:transcriptional regulator with XRE-family HTH domain